MKVVLDTNVIVSALLHEGSSQRLSSLWRLNEIKPYASQPVIEEYTRVLGYPKFGLNSQDLAEVLCDDLLPWLTRCKPSTQPLPYQPKDPDDAIFIAAALGAQAQCLISGDKALLALDGKYDFEILPPGIFLKKHFPAP